mmetsp:Transcript_7145/g.16307  ORF Transcript_7145/g.16307 Transcript_7145/m.16307 type:complete len:301 (-) Transcript_7145:86-988(-)
MVANASTPAPALVWPGSTRALTTQDADRGDVHLKVAQENETLQIWLEEGSSRRQFYASWTNKECAEIVEGIVDPCLLSEMLTAALSDEESSKEATVAFEWSTRLVTLVLQLRSKWVTKAFSFQLAERNVSQVDRLERRLEEVEADLRVAKKARQKEGEHAEMSNWSLRVIHPYYGEAQEGTDGHFAFSGNHFLIQDDAFATKLTGVSTAYSGQGYIQATFPRPMLVDKVKIAPFPSKGWGPISTGYLDFQTLSPQTGTWEVLCQKAPNQLVSEEEIPIGKTILALRLSGSYISISKLIFS